MENIYHEYLLRSTFSHVVEIPHILTHERKLFNLWKKQTDKCPDCVKNFSEKKTKYSGTKCFEVWLKPPNITKTSAKR